MNPKQNFSLTDTNMPSIATIRRLFEASVQSTKKLAARFPLEPNSEGPGFNGYADQGTDLLFVGYGLGLKMAERVAVVRGSSMRLDLVNVEPAADQIITPEAEVAR